MSTKAIRALFEARLATWAATQSPVPKIAFENATFVPPVNAIYLRCFTLANPTSSAYMEATDHIYMGVFQVSIVAPVGVGPGAAEAMAVLLDALFPNFLSLVSTLTVQVITPLAQAPAVQESDAYVVPVSFSYRATTY